MKNDMIYNGVGKKRVKMSKKSGKKTSKSFMEKLIPLVDEYQLCCLKQIQLRAKGIIPPKELEDEKNRCES